MWYRFYFAPEPKIMGCDTQVKAIHGSAVDFKKEFENVFYDQVLDKDYYLDYIELKSKAKFTDILWEYAVREGYFLSEKARRILDDFRLCNARFYPARVVRGNQERTYYLLRLAGDLSDQVDYSRSEFLWYQGKSLTDVPLTFKNADEYRKKDREIGVIDSIRPDKLYLKDEFLAHNYDMIFLGSLSVGDYWINERLKSRLEAENLVGFEFDPCEFLMNG